MNERLYGITNEPEAATYGFRLPELAVSPQPEGETPQAPQEISPELLAVVDGTVQTFGGMEVPEGGCVGEARRVLDEGIPANVDTQLSITLQGQAMALAARDSRFLAVTAARSGCMAESGFSYAEPRDAINDPKFASGPVSVSETAAAVADVRCKRETDYIDVRASLDTAYQAIMMEEHEEQLSLMLQLLETRERNAARALAAEA